MKMKLFNEQGFLTPEGKDIFDEAFKSKIINILNIADDKNEKLIITSILKSYVSDMATKN